MSFFLFSWIWAGILTTIVYDLWKLVDVGLIFTWHSFSLVSNVLFKCAGVDLEAAKRLEEEQIMRDARAWLTDGPPADLRHPKTGATPLHVAAAKGYLEALK